MRNITDIVGRLDATDPLDTLICFTETLPAELRGFLPNAKVVLTQYVFNKIVARQASKKYPHPHSLTGDQLLDVRDAIENPVAIVKSNGKVVVVTDVLDYHDNMILAVFGSDIKSGYNYISSIYGKSNLLLYLYNQQQKDAIAFLDDSRVLAAVSKMAAEKGAREVMTPDGVQDMLEAAITICMRYNMLHPKPTTRPEPVVARRGALTRPELDPNYDIIFPEPAQRTEPPKKKKEHGRGR